MSFLTADDIALQAIGRVNEFGVGRPSSMGPLYRRIGHRQRKLFALTGPLNPERYGACATAALSGGSANLASIAAPVFTPETITSIIINDPGTSGYTSGDRIAVVPIDDQNSELAPRATLRDRVLAQVGTDLTGVNTINIYYSRLPAFIDLNGGATTLELEQPYDTLLEIDLAKWLLTKATEIDESVRATAIASLIAEEKELLGDFSVHVQNYGPVTQRGLSPRLVHPDPKRGT